MSAEEHWQAVTQKEIVEQDVYRLRGQTFDRIIDIGANVGVFATMARFLNPFAEVIALEPDSETFAILRSRVHGLGVECHRLALGDGSSLRVMRSDTTLKTRCIIDIGDDGEHVDSISVGGILKMFSVTGERVMVKIDTEGSERFVYQRPEGLESIKQLSMEVHIGGAGQLSIPEWEEWAKKLGGKFEWTHETDIHRVMVLRNE